MTDADQNVAVFEVDRGIYGVGRLATRLKGLESIGNIGPWHVGHWIDFTHKEIRIHFNSVVDATLAKRVCRSGDSADE